MNQIETVARAIWDEQRNHWGHYRDMLPDLCEWDELTQSRQRELKREAKAAIAAMPPVPTEPVAGWIVGDADQDKWRTWGALGPEWTSDRDKATRYARRCDAEQVHAEDMDAWSVVPFSPTPPAGGSDAE